MALKQAQIILLDYYGSSFCRRQFFKLAYFADEIKYASLSKRFSFKFYSCKIIDFGAEMASLT